jgi:hypothetical protein
MSLMAAASTMLVTLTRLMALSYERKVEPVWISFDGREERCVWVRAERARTTWRYVANRCSPGASFARRPLLHLSSSIHLLNRLPCRPTTAHPAFHPASVEKPTLGMHRAQLVHLRNPT